MTHHDLTPATNAYHTSAEGGLPSICMQSCRPVQYAVTLPDAKAKACTVRYQHHCMHFYAECVDGWASTAQLHHAQAPVLGTHCLIPRTMLVSFQKEPTLAADCITNDMLWLALSVALTDDGSVWTWGSNTDSQLGWPNHACPPDQANSPQTHMRAVAGPQASCSGALHLLPQRCYAGIVIQRLCLLSCFYPSQWAGLVQAF